MMLGTTNIKLKKIPNKVPTETSACTAAVPAKNKAGRISLTRKPCETAVLKWFYKNKV